MDIKEEIRSRLNIEDVIGEYVELKRAGRNLKALSPFATEKTPSFMVSPEKQIWHDFSSNRGGDVFSFVMEVEGVDFREALNLLARKAGIDMSLYQNSERSKELHRKKERLYQLLETAAKFYQYVLSKRSAAKDYVYGKRQFNEEIVERFRLGYAPADGTSLLSFLTQRGFSSQEIRDAGLLTQRRSGPSDMFRDRIMVPLSDGQGRVVGFTARLLADDPHAPKYINTPQTLLYDKGRQVFGLHLAKEAIREKDYVVIVEGNLDVIASHQAGEQAVVATAGTAMTADHLKQLSRLTPHIKLAFDSDKAGVAATERAIVLAQEVGIELAVITLSEGVKDPDELVHKDLQEWQSVIQHATYAVDWLINRYKAEVDLTSAEGKRIFTTKALTIVQRLHDPVEQEHYMQLIAKSIDISLDALNRKLKSAKEAPRKEYKEVHAPTHTPAEDDREREDEDNLLAIALFFPKIRDIITSQLPADSFSSAQRAKLWTYLIEHPREDLTHEVPTSLQDQDTYVKIVVLRAEERYGQESYDDALLRAQGLAARIKKEKQKEGLSALSRALATAERQGDTATAQQLREQVQAIIKEQRHA
jgi:DNA primase